MFEIKNTEMVAQRVEFKTPKESIIQTRKIVSQEHLNPNGTLFGGYLMCWIDEVAFMCARRYSGLPTCVTANIDNISFVEPLKLGEHLMLTACVNYVGRTSMEIGVKVDRENPYTGELIHTNSAYLTFVCLDKNFKPVAIPKLVLESEEDQRRYQEAHLRLKIRKRLKNHLANKIKISNKTKKRHIDIVKSKVGQNKIVFNFQKNIEKKTQKVINLFESSREKIRKISGFNI